MGSSIAAPPILYPVSRANSGLAWIGLWRLPPQAAPAAEATATAAETAPAQAAPAESTPAQAAPAETAPAPAAPPGGRGQGQGERCQHEKNERR